MITIENIEEAIDKNLNSRFWFLEKVEAWPAHYEFIFSHKLVNRNERFYLSRHCDSIGKYELLTSKWNILRSFSIDELKTSEALKKEIELLLELIPD
jgi:hypothetical protein